MICVTVGHWLTISIMTEIITNYVYNKWYRSSKRKISFPSLCDSRLSLTLKNFQCPRSQLWIFCMEVFPVINHNRVSASFCIPMSLHFISREFDKNKYFPWEMEPNFLHSCSERISLPDQSYFLLSVKYAMISGHDDPSNEMVHITDLIFHKTVNNIQTLFFPTCNDYLKAFGILNFKIHQWVVGVDWTEKEVSSKEV